MAPNKTVTLNFFTREQNFKESILFVSLIAAVRGAGEVAQFILTDGQHDFPLFLSPDYDLGLEEAKYRKLLFDISYGGVYNFKNLKFDTKEKKLMVNFILFTIIIQYLFLVDTQFLH